MTDVGPPSGGAMEPPHFSDLGDMDFSESVLFSKPVSASADPFPHKEIITSDGQVIKLRPKRQEGELGADLLPSDEDRHLGIDIGQLLDKIEHDETARRARAAVMEHLPPKSSTNNGVLWAEKWRPKTFLELVGNEKTNRYALRWLRRWSKCVFGEKVVSDRVYNASAPLQFQNPYEDPFDRPEKRIMLIHGPPGIGKTTVAHVIAKQAGYEVMEINASDERAGQRVRDKIVNSLNTQTFSGKPVVLICDEVDGGTESGFIRVLVDLVNQDARATMRVNLKRDDPFSSRNKKDNSRKSKLLMRPIICICNDLYAHSLEKLRPHAEVVSFRKATERSVKDRLREICDDESLNIDTKELSEIVSMTNCDIRSCLNMLQFSGGFGNGGDELRMKDSQINWFTIVKQIFKREPKKSKKDQYRELNKIVSVNNANDKVVNGLFSLYHDVEYQDDLLQKPNEISDWLYFSDYMNKSSFDLQSSGLGSYASQVPMKFFLSFSDPNNTQEKRLRPKSDFEHQELKRANMDLQRKILSRIAVEIRSKMILSTISVQILPFIDKLLTPEIKSPRFNLKPEDMKKVQDALSILTEFGLTIEQKRDETFMQLLTLVPPIDDLTTFSHSSKKQGLAKKTLIYPILLQEIDKIKHLKRKLEEDQLQLEAKVNKKLKTQETEKKFTTTLDYFKSQYDDISLATSIKKKARDEESRIWVKYHEGFSNAVRKNINWDELWSF